MASFTTISEALAAYGQWLPSQPLSTHTRRTYLTQVKQYCTYLSTFHWEYGHPLQEPHARDYAVRDYKTALKGLHLAKPSSVNLGIWQGFLPRTAIWTAKAVEDCIARPYALVLVRKGLCGKVLHNQM